MKQTIKVDRRSKLSVKVPRSLSVSAEEVTEKKEVKSEPLMFRITELPTINSAVLCSKLSQNFVNPVDTLIGELMDSVKGQMTPQAFERVKATGEKLRQQVIKSSKPYAKEICSIVESALGKIKLK